MDFLTCRHCRTYVAVGENGECPCCRRPVHERQQRANPFSEDPLLLENETPPASVTQNPYQPALHHDGPPHSDSPTPPVQGGLAWLLFSFDGRIPRRTFWGCRVAMLAVTFGLTIAVQSIFARDSRAQLVAAFLINPPSLWISLAIEVKRWHDLGKSGWNVLWHLIPFLGVIIIVVQLGFLRGTEGENTYGPAPT